MKKESLKQKNTLLGTFTQYVLQSVLGMIGLSCYILADTFFVATGIGINGLTALNLAIPIFSFISGLGLMIGMGGATRYSISRTDSSKDSGSILFSQSVMLASILAFILMITGIFGTSSLTSLLGADAAVYEDTQIYLRVILIFAPMFLLNHVLICFVRNDGNPKLSMTAMLTGSFSNILLDYVFIFIFHMGMFGAVFATALAPIISIAVLMSHFKKQQNNFRFIKTKFSIKSGFQISSLGISFLITEVSAGIVMIIFNMIILNLKGNIGVAAYGVVANLSIVATALFTGIAQGTQPLISKAYGAQKSKDVQRLFRYALTTGIIIGASIYAIIYVFAEPIANVFNKDNSEEFLTIAATGLRIYFTAFLFVGCNIITAVRFNSVSDSKKSFLISILRGFIFIIPFAFILAKLLEMTGIWLAFPVTEFLTFIVCLILLFTQTQNKS